MRREVHPAWGAGREGGLRGALRLFALLGALFVGGLFAGRWLARALAPGSFVAGAAGTFALPLALGLGMTAWHGTAMGYVGARLARAFWRAARARGDRDRALRAGLAAEIEALDTSRPPPGIGFFVPIGLAVGAAAGVVVGLVPASEGFLWPLLAFTVLGLGYGALLRALALSGRLPLPEEA